MSKLEDNYGQILQKIYPEGEIDCNYCCFDETLPEEKRRKLWRDSRPMPSKDQLQTAWDSIKPKVDLSEVMSLREEAYSKLDGLLKEVQAEMLEGRSDKKEEYLAKRKAIKERFPKGGE